MMGASALASAGKYGAPAVAVGLAELAIGGFDLVLQGGIIIGLMAGAVLRSARYVDDGLIAVRKDWILSGMSGLANFILANIALKLGALVIAGADTDTIAGAGIGLWFGYQGQSGIRWLERKFFGGSEGAQMITPKPPEDTPQAMKDAIRKLDEKDRKDD